ncbi:MAG: hypothetical protein WCK18_08785 [Prolixibacteraceae bacterium]
MATTPTKVRIKGIFKTFFRMIISGNERPMTAIMNASEVPSDAPWLWRTGLPICGFWKLSGIKSG